MKKYISYLFPLIICSCASVRPDKPIIETYRASEISSFNSHAELRMATKGNIVVYVQSKRGKTKFTPDIKTEIMRLQNSGFINKVIDVRELESVDLWSIEQELAKLKSEKVEYALFVSYYDNNSASINTVHGVLKTSTLNLYDLVPVFAFTPVGCHRHEYTTSLEAVMMDVNSGLVRFVESGNAIVNENIRNSSSITNPFDKASKELVDRILSKINTSS